MQTKIQIGKTSKIITILLLFGTLFSAFGADNLPSAHAQEPTINENPQQGQQTGKCFSKTSGKAEECEQAATVQSQSAQSVAGTPLSFYVNDDTSTAMYYNGYQQFYGGNAEGVFIWVNGLVYGPRYVPAGPTTNAYTPVSNSLSGTGSSSNPWKATTVVDVGDSGLRIQQDIRYANGESYVTYSWRVTNSTDNTISYTLFHAADLYTDYDDYGYGYYDSSTGAIGGYNAYFTFYQYFQPITPASHYFEGFYADTWERIGSIYGQGAGFNDTYRPYENIDNSAGLQWNRTLSAYGVNIISDYGVFNTQSGDITCYSLDINYNSSMGSVIPTPAENCPNGSGYTDNTTVALKAVPADDYKFTGWSGDAWGTSTITNVVITRNKTVAANFEPVQQKPVVVLVHGILTANLTFTDVCDVDPVAYHYSASPNSTFGVDAKLRNYFDALPASLNSQGFDVWIAHVASGPLGTPSLNTNAKCLAEQLEKIGAAKIKLIAHSMGGLISRGCVSQNLQGCRDRVDSIMTLGSPHSGTRWLGIQTALRDMSFSKMVDFNKLNPNVLSENYLFLGGDSLPTIIVGVGSVLGDSVVSEASSVGWTDTLGTTNPINWDTGFCDSTIASCSIRPVRIWTDNNHSNYFSNTSEAMQCIEWFLGIETSKPLVCTSAFTYDPSNSVQATVQSSTASSAPLAEGDFGSILQITPIIENTLASGQTTTHTLSVDMAGATTFALMWSGGDPGFTLTRPDDQVIDPTYSATHPSEVTSYDLPGGYAAFNQRLYIFPSAPAGTWQLNITNTGLESSHYYTFAQLTSTRTLNIATSADTLLPDDLLTITATLKNGTTSLLGAMVNAKIIRIDGITDTVALADQGNGIYSATYTVPNVPGYLNLVVTASGNDSDVPFERQVDKLLGISSLQASFNGNYAGSAIDDDSNGKFEALEIQVGVNIITGGDFNITGELASNGQFVAHAAAQAVLASGAQTLTLRFNGDDIRASGLNGPYSLTNLMLVNNELGLIPIASATNVLMIDPYNATDFAAMCFVLNITTNPPLGGALHPNPAPNCNGGLQYTSDSEVTLTVVSNSGYQFTGWSGDISGLMSPASITVNTDKSITANFMQTASQTFGDVPDTYWAWSFIERLYDAGITGGCGTSPLQYCPETTVTRSQMAVFLLRGIHSSSYSPPAIGSSTGFGDVPVDYWSAAWIKQLAAEGITGGCGSGNYCPEYSVTRDQMAVFLLRSKYGSSYSPPAVGASTGFEDVPVDHWAAPWIKQLVTEGITAGCGSGNYCPGLPVTRAQMAVFLVRTFNLP